MTLTEKEASELRRLQKKAGAKPEPLSADDMEEIQQHIESIYDQTPDAFRALCLGEWNRWCGELQTLARNNERLLAEIRRLQGPQQPTGSET